MQITLSKKTVQNLVSGFGKVITTRNRLPALDCVCFSVAAGGDGLRATARATDLDNTLTRTLDASEATVGEDDQISSFLFPLAELKKLRGAIKANETVTLRPLAEDKVEVEAGLISRTVETMPVDEFPLDPPEVPLAACDGSVLLQAMGKAAVTVERKNPARVNLTGVYADPKRGAFVGTDGRRLTLAGLPDFPLREEAIIPAGPALKFMVSQVRPGSEGFAGVLAGKDARRFELRCGLWRWHTRCVDGTYPNYQQVIPSEKTAWTADCVFSDDAANTMLDATRQLPNGETREAVHLALSEKGALIFSPDNGGFVGVPLPECRAECQELVLVSVNRDYLTDALQQGFRRLRVADSQSPLLLTQDNGDLHVLMPLRDTATEKAVDYAAATLGVEKPVESAEPTPAQPEAARAGDEESEPANETGENPATKETTEMTEQRKPESAESENPLARLEELAERAHACQKEAESVMRQTRRAIREVKKHYRDRERQIRGREQDMAKNLKLIERLQEAVAA